MERKAKLNSKTVRLSDYVVIYQNIAKKSKVTATKPHSKRRIEKVNCLV